MAISKDETRRGIRHDPDKRTPADNGNSNNGRKNAKCPRCGYTFISKSNGKCKLRTRVLIFTKTGNTMGICPKCKTNLKVPISLSSGNAHIPKAGKRKRGGDTGR